MEKPVFRRKIYSEILEWKENRSDKYASLIKGARRVGKSTIAEEFAKKEFKSYIMIDFAHTSKAIKDLFDDTYDLDFFFLQLQQLTGTRLFEKESVIIFDEVQLLPDKLEANLGYVYENVVAQMLVAKGNNLFYYTMESDSSNHLYEIDFLTSVGNKICPIEVKSGNYRGHKSLDVFCDKFRSRICEKYVVHTKDYKRENGISYIPVYMVPFL